MCIRDRTSDVFEGRPTANATQMLEGVVPNLNISLSDGKPGRTADFNVRGAGSINGGSALVLIDGVEGSLNSVSPNDIENVSVLKDAASASIYGVRAANGVVLVTTKRGHTDQKTLSYSGSYGIQKATVLPTYINSWGQLFIMSRMKLWEM